METIIKKIIDADKMARQSIDEANAMKQKALDMMTSERDQIYQEFIKESQKEIDLKKKELAEVFEKEKKASEEKYQNSLAQISNLYQMKKDEWVKTIVEKCLEG